MHKGSCTVNLPQDIGPSGRQTRAAERGTRAVDESYLRAAANGAAALRLEESDLLFKSLRMGNIVGVHPRDPLRGALLDSGVESGGNPPALVFYEPEAVAK